MTTNNTFPPEVKASILHAVKIGNLQNALFTALQVIESLTGESTEFRKECEAAVPGEAKMLANALAVRTSSAKRIRELAVSGSEKDAAEYLDKVCNLVANLYFITPGFDSEIGNAMPSAVVKDVAAAYVEACNQEKLRAWREDTFYVDDEGKLRVHQ